MLRHLNSARLGVVVVIALVAAACGSSDSGEERAGGDSVAEAERVTVTLGAFADPLYDAMVWAIREGHVTSDAVDLQIEPLDIAAGLEALNSDELDVTTQSAVAVAKITEAGAPVRVLATNVRATGDMQVYQLVVPAGSDIESFADLRGKKVAVSALGATNVLQLRAALAAEVGLDIALTGGDVEWVQLPPPQMPTALEAGDVDAAYMFFAGYYAIRENDAFRTLGSPQKVYADHFGGEPLISVYAARDGVLDDKGEAIAAALDLIEESKQYYADHTDEVNAAIEAEAGLAAGYVEWAIESVEITGPLTEDARDDLQTLFEVAAEQGDLTTVPDESIFWDGYEG